MPNGIVAHDPDGVVRRRGAEARGGRAPLHGRARPRARRHHRPELSAGTRRRGSRATAMAAATASRASTSSPSTTASSATSCGCSPTRAAAVTVLPATATRRGRAGAKARRRVPVERPGRPGGDRRICRADDQGDRRGGRADLRHLPRPPDARPRARRRDGEDAAGPSRRQPSGEGLHHRQGRDRLDEPRLCARPRQPAGERRGDACLALRRLELRHPHEGQAGLLGAVPPGGVARPAGQPLSVRALRRADAGAEEPAGREAAEARGTRLRLAPPSPAGRRRAPAPRASCPPRPRIRSPRSGRATCCSAATILAAFTAASRVRNGSEKTSPSL